MTRYSSTMTEALIEVREGFSPKQIKMAIGIAADKRYARGNYSGAVRQIEKIKKGLSDHPQVAAVLKRLNTDFDPELEEEEVELDENASKAFDNIIKTGGIDKKDFQKAKQLYSQGKLMDLRKLIYNLDTDPLETIMDVIGKNDPKAFMKMYPKSKRGEYMSSIAYNHGEETLHDMEESADPKIVKAVDKLKKGDTVEIEYDSSIKKGHKGKFKVTAKNTVNKGRTVKTTLQNLANPSGVKHYIYQYKDRDGAYFAIGDMGASMKSLKAGYGEELEETKSATGYEIYHKDFSSAMQHATAFAKSKGQPIKKSEVDNKVATGPRKPSKGKENSYTLETEKGKRWSVQVYNMGNKFELNMYLTSSHVPEGDMLDEKLKVSDGIGAWIKDFMKSDAPQFDGKNMDARRKMAIAAFTDAGGKLESVNEMREPYAVVDTADGNKVVGTASDEKGAKSIITSAELPPMKIKDKKTLKIVKVKKKQMIGQPIKEEEPNKPDSAKMVDQGREDKKKTRIAQLQLQIAKAQETINKLNAQEKPNG